MVKICIHNLIYIYIYGGNNGTEIGVCNTKLNNSKIVMKERPRLSQGRKILKKPCFQNITFLESSANQFLQSPRQTSQDSASEF